MFRWIWFTTLVILLVWTQEAVLVDSARGGTILDTLFGPRLTPSGPVVAYYPPTYAPTTVLYGGSPTVAYQAFDAGTSTTGYSSSSCCQPTMAYQMPSSNCCAPTIVYQVPQDICDPAPVACEPPAPSCWNRFKSCFSASSAPPTRPAVITTS